MTKILVILVFLLVLSGCTVNQEDWRAATRACEHHNGIRLYIVGAFGDELICNDGTRMQAWPEAETKK